MPTVYVRVRSPVELEPALSPAPELGTPVLTGGGREKGMLEGVREGATLEDAGPEEAGPEAAGPEGATAEEEEEEVASDPEGSAGVGTMVRVIVGKGGGEPLGMMLRTRWTRRAWCSASPTAARPATRAMVNLLNSMVCGVK